MNSVTLGALEDAPLDHRLLRLHFLLHNRPHCPAGTHSLIMFGLIITYHLTVRDAGFLRAMGFLPKYIVLILASVSAHCTLA